MIKFKKFILIVSLFLTLINFGFSATEVISQCPSVINNNTEYILSDIFTNNLNPCFNFAGKSNVNITTSGVYVETTLDLSLATSTNIKLYNSKLDGLSIATNSNTNGFEVYNNSFFKQNYILYYQGKTLGIKDFYGFNFHDNYFKKIDPTISLFTMSSTCSAGTCITQRFNFHNMEFYNNDIEGGRAIFSGGGGNGNGYGEIFLSDSFRLENNNIGTNFGWINGRVLSSNILDCNLDLIIDNDYYGYLTLTDNDNDFYTDLPYDITFGSCVKENVPKLTQNTPINLDKVDNNKIYFFNSMVAFTQSNKHYMLTNEMVLNATNHIDLTSSQNSIIDLSLLYNLTALDIKSVRSLRLGNNNKLYGGDDTTKKPIIKTSGVISIVDNGYYGNNWNIIDYANNLEINNINFDLDAVDNYGLIRKSSSGVDGLNLKFYNNIVDINFVPATIDRPFFLFGAFANIKNNQFLLPTSNNVSLFGGGISSNIGGGHLIVDNTFDGGGFIFSQMTDAIGVDSNNFESKIIHNQFLKEGLLYAQPFNPILDTENLLLNPQLNGSYYYKTLCTNYEFNIGNYYQDWFDSGFYNDSDSDGIHNSYLDVNYILRGHDYQGNPIRDYRSVVPYPFSFSTQTGNAINTYDICQSFVYNIISPTEQNYTSGFNFVSNWEFISIAYDNMFCFETLNGFTSIYQDVASGDNKGLEYETTDGKGFFSLKCCDTEVCDNIVKESEIIEFCIGDCNLGNLVVTNVNQPPETILGCTDPNANNYNPLATQNDGSCTYDNGGGNNGGGVDIGDNTFSGLTGLFSSDFDSSGDSVGELFSIASQPLGWLLLIGFVILGFAIISLIFGLAIWVIK